jgi:hypothetical protein
MKRIAALIGCLFAAHANAVDLPGTFIPQAYGASCDPYSVQPDFIFVTTVGKRAVPRHCATVASRNPVFVWTHPVDVKRDVQAALTVTRTSATGSPYSNTITSDVPRLVYPEALPDGQYKWQVVYAWTDSNGVARKYTSSPRYFKVAGTYTLPSAADVLTQVSQHQRPRALPARASYADIYQKVQQSELKTQFETTLTEAQRFLKQEPVGDQDYSRTPAPVLKTRANFSSDDEWNKYVIKLGKDASKERRAIELLGHMYFFTNNAAFLEEAKARLVALAQWDDTDAGPTSEKNQDQANREIFVALAMGLDMFLAPQLKEEQRLTQKQRDDIAARLQTRVAQAMTSVKELDFHPYYGHRMTAVHYLVEALMYAQGLPEYTDAGAHLQSAWNNLLTTTGAWGGMADGGFGNSSAYGWYTANVYARSLAAIRLLSGYDLANFEPLGLIGRNLIAQTPPGDQRRMGPFGDGVEQTQLFWDHARYDFRLLALASGKPEYEWYWRSGPDFATLPFALSAYHFLLLGATTPATPSAAGLPNGFLFEDAGYVAFHSDVTDPKRSSLFFRASQLGTENHSHADNNSFNFYSRGKEIFVSSGFYRAYDDDHHVKWTRQTKSKNALTFDCGTGQSTWANWEANPEPNFNCDPTTGEWTDRPEQVYQTTDASAKLVNYYDDGRWMIATGDATKSYRRYNSSTYKWTDLLGTTGRAYRTVAYSKADGVAIVFDYASSVTPRTWELNFHTLIDPKAGRNSMRIEREGVVACVELHGPNANFVPTLATFPKDAQPTVSWFTEYHTRWKVLAPSTEFAAVTVIKENCTAATTQTTLSNSSIRVDFNGKSITFDKSAVKFQ